MRRVRYSGAPANFGNPSVFGMQLAGKGLASGRIGGTCRALPCRAPCRAVLRSRKSRFRSVLARDEKRHVP